MGSRSRRFPRIHGMSASLQKEAGIFTCARLRAPPVLKATLRDQSKSFAECPCNLAH